MKVNNNSELIKLYDENKSTIEERISKNMSKSKELLVCSGTGCLSSKSEQIASQLEASLKENDLDYKVVKTGCFGFCEKGPIVKIAPDDIFYTKMTVKDAKDVVEKHLVGGEIIKRKLYRDPETRKFIEKTNDIPFYGKQNKIALKNCGVIDPNNIKEYIGAGGFQALSQVLEHNTPAEVVKIVKDSGLRGRGGGGFSTGFKWELTAKADTAERFVICNADEGDPGAFMDRSILESDPSVVVEAMTINGYATKATYGYVYVRAEYPKAVERLQNAIEEAREYGFLGENILGSGFSFDIEIRLGAGAFVCGEETALIASIEGERGMPRNKPPFPAVKGLFDMPTNVNNVETYACIPQIITKGADWFASLGTETSNGTKVFALGGKVQNTGLIEVEMGTTLREAVYDIGGGIPNGRNLKAIQTGGPSGGCLTTDHLDEPIDFDNLTRLGSMMGSGGMIVIDDLNCMVDIAKFYLEFTVEESCGKCTPCREGTKKMHEILEKITEGKATMDDLERLKFLAETTKDSSLCGLGQTAPNPVLSTLNTFYDEYLAHIVDHRCPAGVCGALTKLFITDDCIGCTKCAKQCPVDCISGNLKELHVIDVEQCINCNSCIKVCPKDAIISK